MMLLEINNLAVSFNKNRALRGLDLSLEKGGIHGLVGETGAGKTVASLSIMGLVPCPPGRIEGGEVIFQGRDLLKLPEAELRKLRGK